jgi:hypothetical protein
MKKLIYILFLSLFICIGCSSGDDDNTSKTFLENYAGTIWMANNDDELYDYYMRFINNLDAPIESWDIYYYENDCYEYEHINLTEIGYEITENLDNKFQLKYFMSELEAEYGLITLTILDNSLELEFAHVENGNITSKFTDYYISTSIDVDSFIICDDT